VKKLIAIFTIAGLALSTAGIGTLRAEDATDTKTTLKEDLDQKLSALKEQKSAMQTHAREAKQEENVLRDQIKTAVQSGDKTTAQQLRESLKTTHQENVQQRKDDKSTMKTARQDLRADRKIARQTRRGRGGMK